MIFPVYVDPVTKGGVSGANSGYPQSAPPPPPKALAGGESAVFRLTWVG